MQKSKNTKNLKTEKCIKKNYFFAHIKPFFYQSEVVFSKQFSLNSFSCFLFNAQHCLETSVNCVWNCVTPLLTPLEVQFSKLFFFFQKCTHSASEMLYLLEGDIWKVSMRKIRDIFNQGPYKSQFCVKLVDALLFQENVLAITFTWQNEH